MEASLTTLFDLQDCLAKFSEAEAHAKEAVDLCPMMFDSWNCWEAASPGTVQKMACPNFPHLGFNPSSKKFYWLVDKRYLFKMMKMQDPPTKPAQN